MRHAPAVFLELFSELSPCDQGWQRRQGMDKLLEQLFFFFSVGCNCLSAADKLCSQTSERPEAEEICGKMLLGGEASNCSG
jgi:hypothetical protein